MARPKKVTNDYRTMVVTPTEAAKFLDIPERTFYRLVENGVIPKTPGGEYLLGELTEAYWKSLVDGGGLNVQKTRLTRAQADLAELELAEEKGELHRAAAVMAVWAEIVHNAKSKLLALPSKIAPLLQGLDIASAQQIIKDHIYEVLHEIADYDERRIARASASRRK